MCNKIRPFLFERWVESPQSKWSMPGRLSSCVFDIAKVVAFSGIFPPFSFSSSSPFPSSSTNSSSAAITSYYSSAITSFWYYMFLVTFFLFNITFHYISNILLNIDYAVTFRIHPALVILVFYLAKDFTVSKFTLLSLTAMELKIYQCSRY